MRLTRKAFNDAQINTGLGGAEIRKLIRGALEKDHLVTITEPDDSESKVGRDNRGKFTFTPIAKN